MANLSQITRCGLPGIERAPFGMYACTFIAAVTSSLRRWCRTLSRGCAATSARSRSGVARRVRRRHPGGCSSHPRLGAAEGTRRRAVMVNEEERALADGYNGLCIAGDTRFLTTGDWSTLKHSTSPELELNS
jgi:hypothetical protein